MLEKGRFVYILYLSDKYLYKNKVVIKNKNDQ